MNAVPNCRRTRKELKDIIENAEQELSSLEELLPDTFAVDTVLKFTQNEKIWIVRKLEEKDSNDDSMWFDYENNMVDNYEHLFPGNISGLEISILTPSVIWTAPGHPELAHDSFNGFDTKDNE